MIVVSLLIILATLQYKLWFGDGSVLAWQKSQNTLEKLNKKNEILSKKNRHIALDIKALKSGDQAIEEQARHELGMIKEDEVYYQVVDSLHTH
ncbi:MAG: septum formation initiator family protein [Legionellaceae bacterium]|nr:septum formation initiator family protein [Legionellaceae bacterium]